MDGRANIFETASSLLLWSVAGFLAVLFSLFSSKAGEIERTDVFVSGEEGYHTYRIPALVVATNGTLIAFCEGRKTSGGDSGEVHLLLKRSRDGGRTWTAQQVIWSDGANTCGNPAPVVDRVTGMVWVLMTWNLGTETEKAITSGTAKDTRRVFVTHSGDNGVTWADPVEITSAVKLTNWHWYATGPVNGIQLTRGPHRGRLLIPANHSELADGRVVSRSHVIFSDDHGASWQIGGSEEEKTNESTLVELADGSILQNMRSYHGRNRRAVATSKDGGLSWSAVRLDEALIEPVCEGSLLRWTWADENGDGKEQMADGKEGEAGGRGRDGKERRGRILFCNPASLKRENLTVRVSYDEGATWAVSKAIYSGAAAYSCMAVLPDKSIGCLYENGEKQPYERISLARFGLDWLERKF